MVYRVIHWNCRGIRTNGHWLRTQYFSNSHVICLQETFLDAQSQSSFSLPGMHIYSTCRSSGYGGGIMTAVRSSIPSHRFSLPLDPSGTIESLGVKVWVNDDWLTIINLYLPRGLFIESWFDELVRSINSPFLLVGDFNINLLRTQPPFPMNVQSFHKWTMSHNVCVCNTNSPTRIAYGAPPSLLDLTVCSTELYNKITYNIHPDPFDSDHQPVTLDITSNSSPLRQLNRRPVVNWTRASLQLNQILDCSGEASPNYDRFSSSCQKAISSQKFIPNFNRTNAPWWDSTCRKLLGIKRRFLRLARTHCSKEYWLQYKQSAGKLRRRIKTVSRQYWNNLCSASSSNGRIFKILKALARRTSPYGDNLLWSGSPVATYSSQANLFLEYFSQSDSLHPIPYDLSGGNDRMNAPFSFEEFNQAIKNTRPTTPGADGISIKLLCTLSLANKRKLLTIFNNLLLNAIVPPSWKVATIVPVCKPGKPPHLVTSHRPIALTSVCSKVFERMVLQRLVFWAGSANIFQTGHFGFMPFKDSTSALCKFYEDITAARDSRLPAFAVCLDIRSAYDSVWVDGLIYKLSNYGIRGDLGLWISRFLSNRSIIVRWKSVLSDSGPCERGVPQGSVLSPILFTLFMADIFEILESHVELIVYADDIILYATGTDPSHTLSKLQNCLDRLAQWCSANCLSISPGKCQAINFSRRKVPMLKTMGHEMEWNASVKILGVWFSPSLSFTHHFTYLRSKAFKRLNYVKAVVTSSRGVRSQHMLYIVNSLIRSLLEYACPLLLSACPSSLTTLEIIYNAALRVATGLPKFTPIPLLRRVAGASSVTSRLSLLTHNFLIRQLSLPQSSFLNTHITTGSAGRIHLKAEKLLSLYNIDPDKLILFSWPTYPSPSHNAQIILDGLAFHIPTIPDSAIRQAWYSWRASLGSCTLIATDASKDDSKTAIAAYNDTEETYTAMLTPHANSIFTAEALAIYLALSLYATSPGTYALLTDSLSVLRALCNTSIRSPRVILLIHSLITKLTQNRSSNLTLIWCPSHKGIPPNEKADRLARNGPYLTQTLNLTAPEDLITRFRCDWNTEKEYSWMNSDYYHNFPHLHASRNENCWTSSRQEDVWIARWLTRMWPSNSRLYRMNLAPSPLCSFCHVPETPDHILLDCSHLSNPRTLLLSSLNLSPPLSYPDVLCAALSSRKGVSALCRFSAAASGL